MVLFHSNRRCRRSSSFRCVTAFAACAGNSYQTIAKDPLRMHTDVAAVLIDIEAELRRLRLWDDAPPSPQALASTQPFAIDTLTLPQWLQFIFLPTMYRLIDEGADLPTQCGITPMAEEYFRGREVPISGLLDALERIDELLSDGEPVYAPAQARKER